MAEETQTPHEAAQEGAPHWAAELVQGELLKALPEGLAKEVLQERCGIGPSDIRDAIDYLLEEDLVVGTEDGWRAVETDDAPETLPEDAGPETEEREARDGDPLRADPLADLSTPQDQFTARITLDVTWAGDFPDDMDPGEALRLAVDQAEQLKESAVDGITSDSPSVAVGAEVSHIDAARPTRIYDVHRRRAS